MKLFIILILILVLIYLSGYNNEKLKNDINNDINVISDLSKNILTTTIGTAGNIGNEIILGGSDITHDLINDIDDINIKENVDFTFVGSFFDSIYNFIFGTSNINYKNTKTKTKTKTKTNTNTNNNNIKEEKCINPLIYNYLHKNESFSMIDKSNTNFSFKQINPNNLYYGLDCKYIKKDCFYDALKELGFKSVDGKNTTIVDASLIVPCSYETTEKEIKDLEKNGIQNNIYKDGVRIFMLNNTDFMVSKLSLWQYLVKRYGETIASTMIPYTWDLTNQESINKFKKDYDPKKIYITKNNNQRQEGINIHTSLDSILNTKNKLLVQELLQNPYTINRRKINLRVYVLVIKDTHDNFKVLVYDDGFMYYTPEYFEPNNPDFKKNITTGYIDRKVYEENPLTHQDFRTYLDSSRNLTPIEQYIKDTKSNIQLSEYVFSQIYHMLAYIFETYDNTLGTKTFGVSFQLYGVDVAIDDELRPQIMEINKGPDLSAKDAGRDKQLKINLCKDLLGSVGLVNNYNNNKFINILEKVNINGKMYYINDFSN